MRSQEPSIGHEAMPSETNSQKKERRKECRCKMKMTACIRYGNSEDVVTVLDASRTGIRFQSSKQYHPNTWVQVAVPYMGGTSDIFVSGRIVWRKTITASLQEYGLQYERQSVADSIAHPNLHQRVLRLAESVS